MKETVPWEPWGNWYIMRSSHEFGWASQFACLNYYGLFTRGHKVLFDTPIAVRSVDIAVSQLPFPLRQALALKYWWHRDLKGSLITDRLRAETIGLGSPSSFKEVLRTAKWLGEIEYAKLLERRQQSATIGYSSEATL